MTVLNTNLRNRLEILHANPRALDTDFPATVGAFPYISSATNGDWVFAGFDKITRYVVR